jgi:NDP-sugar pyrophosphorylase family protein
VACGLTRGFAFRGVKAVLLAAGLGTRLASAIGSLPKILAPLGGRPLLAHQLDYLAREGVSEVAVNVHHHADKVARFLDEAEQPLRVQLFPEAQLLGTAGALVPMAAFLVDEPFVVLYGDVVTNAGLPALMRAQRRVDGLATLAYYRTRETVGKGVLDVRTDGRIVGFAEKSGEARDAAAVNAGIYAVAPEILRFVYEGADFGHDVWPAALGAGSDLYGYEIDCYIRDIGSPSELQAATRDLDEGRFRW